MIKKLLIGALCLLPMVGLMGCGQMDSLSLVQNNMSERADVYYFSNNENLKISLASGQRESTYNYDGVSTNKVDFALIVAQLDSADTELCQVTIDGVQSDVLLEFNYRTGTHMADLERKLTGEEEIQITYGDQTATMVNKSNEFAVSSSQAIQLGCQHLQEFIEPLCDGNNFDGECYLRIMDTLTGEENGALWLFSVMSKDGQIKNVIISTTEQIVLADDGGDVV